MKKISKNNFKEKVLAIVKKIPKGKTMTYKEVATKAGNPAASRAVGGYMSKNADKTIPCHRVVRSDGKIGGYNGLQGKKTGADAKIALLRKEGVKI
ncbi:MAG TPA: MGMT family protein [Candidatus Paceibacterota bacterium]|nr:MGMT family protein [Candidatus Paceibacterota bacterium]